MKVPFRVQGIFLTIRFVCPVPVARPLRPRNSALLRLILERLIFCVFAANFFTPALVAQQDASSGSASPGWPMHSSAPDHAVADAVATQPVAPTRPERDESCLLWTVSTPQASVKAATLQVPGKARSEFKKGCSEVRSKKFAGAETHLRKALDQYPNYPPAWVLLGQVLEAGNRMEEARVACAKATTADADYVPAYLCLADVAGQKREWQQTLESADRALTLDPGQNVYGHFYCAMAQLHLNQLSAALSNAQASIDADHFHHLPQAHLVLAQVYGAQHDLQHAVVQLRAYLEFAPNAPDAGEVRKRLADLEEQSAKE
jgi:tetratricopeptide (TPR) repeat protein